MRKIYFIFFVIFFISSCNSKKQLANEILVAYRDYHNIPKQSAGSRLTKLFFEKCLQLTDNGDYIYIQKLEDQKIAGSSSSIVAIKYPNKKTDYYVFDEEMNLFEKRLFDEYSLNKIQFDYIIDKIKNHEINDLLDLHEEEKRNLSHPSDISVVKFTIKKNQILDINKIIFFEEFAVSWKDSKDKEVREISNE